MVKKTTEIFIMGGLAILMFVLAYAIGVKRKMHLIAGYNGRTAIYVTDKAGLARLVGRLCLLVGIASGLMPLATYFWGSTAKGWAMCMGHYGGFLLGVIALTVLQSRDYIASARERKNIEKNLQWISGEYGYRTPVRFGHLIFNMDGFNI